MADRVLAITAGALVIGLGVSALASGGISPARQAELTHMVTQDCGSCHGLTMKGGLGSPITPADLEGRDPEGLAVIILDGIPGTAMPPWRPLLTQSEAIWIAEYLLRKDKR